MWWEICNCSGRFMYVAGDYVCSDRFIYKYHGAFLNVAGGL